MSHFERRIFCTVVITFFILIGRSGTVSAQIMKCDTPAEKVACQAALDQVNAELVQANKALSTAQAKSSSLTNDIAVLQAKIKAAELNIKAKNLLILTLGNDIASKQNHIDDLEGHINKGKASLADLMRKMRELDTYSLPEVLLSKLSISDFFTDVDTFQSIQDSLQSTFHQLKNDQASTTIEKDALTEKQNTEIDARYTIQQQQASIQRDQADQKQLLSISKGNEKAYANLVTAKSALAAQIRAALFPLAGGGKAIPFGTALQYAQVVAQKTGVQPAFLLALLTQETNLGGNVGTCYLGNISTGSGINVRTGAPVSKVMNPTRDVPPFISIVKSLGYDPYKATVSCPQSIGWGGGMGPAQFIASTWILFEDRVASSMGITGTPSPWDPQAAFMAAGIYLSDLGAGSSSYSAQKTAACKYYSGRACGYVTGATSYANSVLSLAYTSANSVQSKINAIQGL